jgi:hypothetical protein
VSDEQHEPKAESSKPAGESADAATCTGNRSTQPPEKPPKYGSIATRRCAIWLLALLVAAFVPLHSAGWPFHFFSWMQRVEANHKLQDAFLAVVAMVVLSGTDFFEIVFPRAGAIIKKGSRIFGYFAMFIYFLFILFGMAQFDALEHVQNHDEASSYWVTMVGLLFLGLVGELVIAREQSG